MYCNWLLYWSKKNLIHYWKLKGWTTRFSVKYEYMCHKTANTVDASDVKSTPMIADNFHIQTDTNTPDSRHLHCSALIVTLTCYTLNTLIYKYELQNKLQSRCMSFTACCRHCSVNSTHLTCTCGTVKLAHATTLLVKYGEQSKLVWLNS